MRSRTIAFQAALEVGLWFTCQNTAMAVCSGVRVSEIWRTSARSALYLGDPKAGGGGGRNSLVELR
jgi:hypothetical protein